MTALRFVAALPFACVGYTLKATGCGLVYVGELADAMGFAILRRR
jgi:hypothetical protein